MSDWLEEKEKKRERRRGPWAGLEEGEKRKERNRRRGDGLGPGKRMKKEIKKERKEEVSGLRLGFVT